MRRAPQPLWARAAVALLLCAALPAAQAELVEEVVAAQRAGEGDVLRLRLNRPVQVRQQSPLAESDVYRVRLELVLGSEPLDVGAPAERRRVGASGPLPELTLELAAGATPGARELTIQLRERRALTVRQGPSPREVDLVFAPAADAVAAAPAAPAEPADAAQREVEDRAAALMQQARAALQAQRHDDAVKLLNELLLLPPNRQSEAAQAQVGDAWVGAGNTRRARLEYELYLKLYPQGADAARVAEALAAAGGAVPRAPAAADAGTGAGARPGTPAPAAPPAASFAGSLAQYLSNGHTKAKSLVTLPAGLSQTLSRATERSLITSVDLSGRWSSAESELRGAGPRTTPSTSLISAAYADWRDLQSQLAVRLGRQSAISGGLLGTFDGVSLAYPLRQGIKVDLMGGVPANQLIDSPQQRLLGAMVELDGLVEGWGGNTYFVDQTSEGYVNRRALGGELRYANDAWSGYALVDYDVALRSLNAVTLQASWLAPEQTTVTLLVDDRKAPALALVNALILRGGGTIDDLVRAGATLDQLRQDALATSAWARQAMVSVSRPLNPKWQLSGDLRVSEVGALPQIGNEFEATPATGRQTTLSVQATGSNLYSSRDINSFSVAVIRTPQFKGVQAGVSNLTGFGDNDLTLEPSLRYYAQTDVDGLRLSRVSGGLRLSWRLSARVSVLAEGLVEHTTTSGATSSGNTNATSFYVGYRYELF